MKEDADKFIFPINSVAQTIELKTDDLFDTDFLDASMSAIDKFIEKSRELNKLVKVGKEQESLISSLILLGYVSAVESYFREIIRRLILIDKASKEASEMRQLSYGAATSHAREMLPEALLEHCTFISRHNVIETFKNFLGVKGQKPIEVETVLAEYSRVCQLRHCVVHRFGRLGSNNAIELGLSDHEKNIEKPLKLNEIRLQDIFLVCTNTVKVINNFLFEYILSRSANQNPGLWKWNLTRDKSLFRKYYELFISELDPPEPFPRLNDAYYKFRDTFQDKRHSP